LSINKLQRDNVTKPDLIKTFLYFWNFFQKNAVFPIHILKNTSYFLKSILTKTSHLINGMVCLVITDINTSQTATQHPLQTKTQRLLPLPSGAGAASRAALTGLEPAF
jgi:hypothetical protein